MLSRQEMRLNFGSEPEHAVDIVSLPVGRKSRQTAIAGLHAE